MDADGTSSAPVAPPTSVSGVYGLCHLICDQGSLQGGVSGTGGGDEWGCHSPPLVMERFAPTSLSGVAAGGMLQLVGMGAYRPVTPLVL